MDSRLRAAKLVVVVVVAATALAAGQGRKEFRYSVGPHSTISVVNQYGPISVKAGPGGQVVVTAVLHSDKVEIDQSQSGNRVELLTHLLPGGTPDNGHVEYEVQVPADCSLTLRSAVGPIHAEGLTGDLNMEGSSAKVDARDLNGAHVYVKTLNGAVTLVNIRDGHVDVTSVNGDVTMNEVDGQQVMVNSTTGHIRYDGDFGSGGAYRLSSHSGDIDATAPRTASIDVTARSEKGQVENDFPLQPKHTPFVIKAGSAFAGTMGKAASSVKLFTFSGKIHLKIR